MDEDDSRTALVSPAEAAAAILSKNESFGCDGSSASAVTAVSNGDGGGRGEYR